MRAVALGGGHGLHATLSAVRRVTPDVTAIVTVADDGGSSGRLRRELGLLPPGDLRQAFAAFAAEDGGTLWAEVFQHRFGGDGALAGHAVGNLLLAGLFEVLGDPVAALDEACRLIGVSGRVLPMSPEPLEIVGEVSGLDSEDPAALRTIRGQVAVASTPGQVQRVSLHTPGRSGRPPQACAEAVDAVLAADVVFLGPGSWFTSVLPHLLVPGLHDALVKTTATKVLVLNLVPQPGETAGFSPERHLDVLSEHAPDLRVDAVIADRDSVPDPANLRRAAERLGGRAHLGAVADPEVAGRHDPDALARCMREALGLGRGGEHGGGAQGREGQ
ncbi:MULTISPECIES: uridine diphosphate-N-acetylglucosamine-binding protein YvcK [unclassified Amycolatopsis]|uniref:gluconeogenesis factor YvcK family protein n=1 Tax=unclassified Amycolatopsis TaxID=2618356 RepID=UPI001FF649D5|nr:MULTISPECIES: uridine diphosphate-N-acetylglucosamine-binding protein YvcK [unclassified Amycolatopsis]UOZ02547.1 uridine diphosphate-N-acetylglucosamine-binding protein YvcK [Amycolatopsis sp. WQ 127309]WSJ81862.1 uridine diphosphate-N-acetylglucosamine-binding protein YvcK [Amycolatopsis sp. NBC_01307]WSK78401.1 uridine diphosphate-N-acetylglucosamine-binding protein YvcK [Amycolatopsis sp. NBC_01286]